MHPRPWARFGEEQILREEHVSAYQPLSTSLMSHQSGPGLAGKTKSSAVHAKSAVMNFQRWLFEKCSGETRTIDKIQPGELDPLLAEYFRLVQKPGGGNYTFDSFRLLRPNIQNYLQAHNYPYNIVSSSHFPLSKIEFYNRKFQLKEEAAEILRQKARGNRDSSLQ